jgi:hypothetical protein
MTWDLLFNLAGAWHLYCGHTAHSDSREPGFIPKALLVEVVAACVVFASSSVIALCRLPIVAAAIFTAFVTLLILMPVNIGDALNHSFLRYGPQSL